MNSFEIVRSWKDEDYRLSLINKEQALAPENPAGLLELNDEDLVAVEGGALIRSLCLS
jgi:mersacidin/lichenicidin family type 2 lantibiotic